MVKPISPEDADIILFNTCSVREKAQEKVFTISARPPPETAEPRSGDRRRRLRCQPGRAAIVARAPYVDVVFGPQTLHRLPQLIAERRAKGKPAVDISFPEIEKFDALPPAKTEGRRLSSRSWKAAQILHLLHRPHTRGEEVSRPFDDVLTEVAGLADQGQGSDPARPERQCLSWGAMGWHEEMATLAMLIEYIAEMPGIERIRYTTSHPREMTQRLIDTYASVPKLVSHLHLPVQSGSDRILAAMKRNYTHARIQVDHPQAARAARTCRCRPTSSSAFPARPKRTTEDDEADRRRRFRPSFSFLYSRAPGTPAAELTDDTPAEGQDGAPDAPAETDRGTGLGDQRGHGRQRAARAGRRPFEERMPMSWPAAPTTTASVNFGGPPAPDPHLCRCAHHLRAAAFVARRDRDP